MSASQRSGWSVYDSKEGDVLFNDALNTKQKKKKNAQ